MKKTIIAFVFSLLFAACSNIQTSQLESIDHQSEERDTTLIDSSLKKVQENPITRSPITKYSTSNLNLRDGPDISYSIVTVIPKGTAILIDEDCECSWIPVRYNQQEGYVCSKYISLSLEYYTNGDRVQSPAQGPSHPAGAIALCNDGTYSFSKHRQGTCSHHGGVAEWFYDNSTKKSSSSKSHTKQYSSSNSYKTTTPPAGATALCNDGTYSYSQNRRGTCSHHGGVAVWY